jgi:hypothetical protein
MPYQPKTDYFASRKNPFLLPEAIEEKVEYTIDELVHIQTMLREMYIDDIIEDEYHEDLKFPFYWFRNRCAKGITQTIIDVSNNLLPIKELVPIGNGSCKDCCFVCSTALADDRCQAAKRICESLNNVGFNGYMMMFQGGFPNPTGKEMKYIGVPYSFKIFAMVEAHLRGFNKVIWLDAACYALNNVEPLFQRLETCDVIFNWFNPNQFEPEGHLKTYERVILPSTLTLLEELSDGRNIRDHDKNVNSIVFGLNMASPRIMEFVKEYYDMVEMGLPFLSAFPEEIVFSTIFNKPEYKYVFDYPHVPLLYIHETHLSDHDARAHGYFFHQRAYR